MMIEDELPAILTVDQLRGYLHCGRAAAYNAVRTGQIPSFRLGRLIRISRAALLAAVASGAIPPPEVTSPAAAPRAQWTGTRNRRGAPGDEP